ncbi:MAG: hypothetical protein DRR19_02295 [Candidatus Parabeggiatoa sp. nov. 1]|nr:MAG: hypothetical protein DRR19_02295 [Gammaproteobacteria bacterium]
MRAAPGAIHTFLKTPSGLIGIFPPGCTFIVIHKYPSFEKIGWGLGLRKVTIKGDKAQNQRLLIKITLTRLWYFYVPL